MKNTTSSSNTVDKSNIPTIIKELSEESKELNNDISTINSNSNKLKASIPKENGFFSKKDHNLFNIPIIMKNEKYSFQFILLLILYKTSDFAYNYQKTVLFCSFIILVLIIVYLLNRSKNQEKTNKDSDLDNPIFLKGRSKKVPESINYNKLFKTDIPTNKRKQKEETLTHNNKQETVENSNEKELTLDEFFNKIEYTDNNHNFIATCNTKAIPETENYKKCESNLLLLDDEAFNYYPKEVTKFETIIEAKDEQDCSFTEEKGLLTGLETNLPEQNTEVPRKISDTIIERLKLNNKIATNENFRMIKLLK